MSAIQGCMGRKKMFLVFSQKEGFKKRLKKTRKLSNLTTSKTAYFNCLATGTTFVSFDRPPPQVICTHWIMCMASELCALRGKHTVKQLSMHGLNLSSHLLNGYFKSCDALYQEINYKRFIRWCTVWFEVWEFHLVLLYIWEYLLFKEGGCQFRFYGLLFQPFQSP